MIAGLHIISPELGPVFQRDDVESEDGLQRTADGPSGWVIGVPCTLVATKSYSIIFNNPAPPSVIPGLIRDPGPVGKGTQIKFLLRVMTTI